jgi:tetratricopeptide (TPR) repeat protein
MSTLPVASARETSNRRSNSASAQAIYRANKPDWPQRLQQMRNTAEPLYFLGAESLALAHVKRGDLDSALNVLEAAAANRTRVNFVIAMAGAPFWMQDEMDLARLYRRLGRVQDAEKIENELRKLLAYADPDFPLPVELKRLQNTAASARTPN